MIYICPEVAKLRAVCKVSEVREFVSLDRMW